MRWAVFSRLSATSSGVTVELLWLLMYSSGSSAPFCRLIITGELLVSCGFLSSRLVSYGVSKTLLPTWGGMRSRCFFVIQVHFSEFSEMRKDLPIPSKNFTVDNLNPEHTFDYIKWDSLQTYYNRFASPNPVLNLRKGYGTFLCH